MPIGKCNYVPVLFFGENELKGQEVLGMPPRYWTWWHKEESVFWHPHLLLNAYGSLNQPDCRSNLHIGSDCRVLGDSGGFQIFKQTVLKGQKLDIDPVKILRWQERNSDCGFILDWPMGSEDTDEFYEHGLQETIKNCQVYQDHAENPKLKILRVLHGHTETRIKRWYDELQKFDFLGNTGWSFGFHPSGDVFGQARMFAFLYSQGHRGYLHFLGVSGWNTMPLIVYASRFMEEIVFDSSSYAEGFKTKSYQLPADMGRGDISFGDRIQSWHEMETPPCVCPVCNHVRDSGVPFSTAMCDPVGSGHLISLHNLYMLVERTKKLHSLVADKERYHKYVHDNCSTESYMSLQYIDEVMRIGYTEATKEYSRWCKRLEVTNQMAVSFGAMFHTGGVKPKEKQAIRLPGVEKPPKVPKAAKVKLCAYCSKSEEDHNDLTCSWGFTPKMRGRPKKAESVVIPATALALPGPHIVSVDFDHPEQTKVDGLPVEAKGVYPLQTDPEERVVETVGSPENPFPDLLQVVHDAPLLTINDMALPNCFPTPSQKKDRKLRMPKEVPKLLNLEEVEKAAVKLDVLVEKPVCFGNYEKDVCDGSFCTVHYEPCQQESVK
jgi:queuine/archaeosine tRNA-ribosyltransferase